MGTKWEKLIGGDGRDYLQAMIESEDGHLILAGNSTDSENGDRSSTKDGIWLVKITKEGTKVFDKTYWCDGGATLVNLISMEDGGFLIGANSSSDSSGMKSQDSKGGKDYWILRTDENGSVLWDRTIGGSGSDNLSDLVATEDGGHLSWYFIFGGSRCQVLP